MEDIISTINDKELSQLIFVTLLNNSEKIKPMLEKLKSDPNKLENSNLKEKYEKCFKEATNIYDNFVKEIDLQMSKRPPIRIYVDGVFDIIHSGHFNGFRQSKKLGEQLVIGINSDEDVLKVKGPTLMDVNERGILALASKWSDEVALNTPYTPTLETIAQYKCNYLSHGDDMPVNENGESCYTPFIKEKKIRIFQRTEGISTTDITGKLLLTNKDKVNKLDLSDPKNVDFKNKFEELEKLTTLNHSKIKSLLLTSWRLAEFSNKKLPKQNDKIVYLCGDFDVLQKGHIEAIQQAKKLGDFLYIGLFDDSTIKDYKGNCYPILNLNERTLNTLSLKNVDEVIIGAPSKITQDMIDNLHINVVVRFICKNKENEKIKNFESDLYEIPKKIGILKEIEFDQDLVNDILIEKIWERKEEYLTKYLNKIKKEYQAINAESSGIAQI